MTPIEIATAASRLGIRLTRSPVGSQIWEAWADRVREADMRDQQYQRWSLIDSSEPLHAIDFARDRRREAIAEANAYTV